MQPIWNDIWPNTQQSLGGSPTAFNRSHARHGYTLNEFPITSTPPTTTPNSWHPFPDPEYSRMPLHVPVPICMFIKSTRVVELLPVLAVVAMNGAHAAQRAAGILFCVGTNSVWVSLIISRSWPAGG